VILSRYILLKYCVMAIWKLSMRLTIGFLSDFKYKSGTAVAQLLSYSATNRKVAGSIPDGVVGNFH
jgi:hypothetical protein